MREPTVIASAPKAFLEFAATRGADAASLLRRAGIQPVDLADPNGRVPVERYVALMEAAITLCHEPALALLYGERVPAEALSIVPFITAQGSDAEDVRSRMSRYAPLMIDDGSDVEPLEILPRDGKVFLKLASPLYKRWPVLTESGVARSVCGARRMLSSRSRFPDALHFTHAEPMHRKEYDRLFGVPLTFGSEMNAIVVDPSFLSVPMPTPFRAAAAMVTERAEQLLARLKGPSSTRGAVEDALLRGLEHNAFGMDEIARQLGLSRATLFRKLKTEGVTFAEVLDAVRRERALRYLDEENRSVGETALLLGFSDAAAFSRAFKRWTGGRPTEVRRR